MLDQASNLMTLTQMMAVPQEHPGRYDLGSTEDLPAVREWLEPSAGAGYCETVWLSPDLFVYVVDAAMHDNLSETMDGDGWAAFHLRLRGLSTDRIARSTQFSRRPGTFATVIYPSGVERTETHAAKERFCSVAVAFRPAAMQALALTDTALLAGPMRGFVERKHANFFYQAAPLDAPMSSLARDVLTTGLTGRLRRLYIEAKAMELLCLAWQQAASGATTADRSQVRLTAADRERLHAVRAHVETKQGDIPGLARLSRLFGLNRNKLVYGFKTLFGQSVFEFSRQQRLGYARSLLLESSLSVTEVALRAGYENPSSFTRAFQLEFGHSPRCTRRGVPSRSL